MQIMVIFLANIYQWFDWIILIPGRGTRLQGDNCFMKLMNVQWIVNMQKRNCVVWKHTEFNFYIVRRFLYRRSSDWKIHLFWYVPSNLYLCISRVEKWVLNPLHYVDILAIASTLRYFLKLQNFSLFSFYLKLLIKFYGNLWNSVNVFLYF